MELEKNKDNHCSGFNKLTTHSVLNKHQQNSMNVLFRIAAKIEIPSSRVFTIM